MKHVKHIEINVIAVAIHLLLHDRAGTLASIIYYGSLYHDINVYQDLDKSDEIITIM